MNNITQAPPITQGCLQVLEKFHIIYFTLTCIKRPSVQMSCKQKLYEKKTFSTTNLVKDKGNGRKVIRLNL